MPSYFRALYTRNNLDNYISVQLIRRLDTRIPRPLLSASVPTTTPNFGKLVTNPTLRSSTPLTTPSAPTTRPSSALANNNALPGGNNTNTPSSRGWTSVVSGSAPQTRAPRNSGSAWDATTDNTTDNARSSSRLVPLRKPSPPATSAPEQDTQDDVPDNWENDDM